MSKTKAILVLLLALLSLSSMAQQRFKLYGKVVDEYDNPVEFASIIVERQGAFAVTGLEGSYSLRCTRTDSLFITCMAVGYRTKKFFIAPPQSDSLRYDMKISTMSYMLGEAGITAMRRQTDLVQRIKSNYTRNMPSTTGNGVEEIIATQMGVSTHNELSSQYNVRGGSFDENCVYLNGVEIFRPMLVRSGQQEGLSIINSNMVADIDFSAGGFPARYGDKMSSVLDITYKRPEHLEGSVGLSLMGGDAYVGFGNEKFSMMNGLRYKTTKHLISSGDTKAEYRPDFIDYQNYTSWSPTKHWTLDFIGNVSYNRYSFKPSDRETSFGTMQDVKKFKVYFDGKEK
ncbi:MAG: carboxypeptidase-like regulatory domain-containing protein, partial [Bacteroidaceae bacterium]|nr:carboxypeptidase-like regulatory domain-containing protein [Bacteroidaceae bacterium]